MVKLHPKILEKDGKKEFAVLPYAEFLKIKEELEDFEALKALRDAKAKESDSDTLSLAETKEKFGIE
jgi:hypothetical protein